MVFVVPGVRRDLTGQKCLHVATATNLRTSNDYSRYSKIWYRSKYDDF